MTRDTAVRTGSMRWRSTWAWAILLLTLACLARPAHAAAAAQVVGLTGQGETRPAQTTGWSAAHLNQYLDAGTDIRTLAYSSAALLLADATQIRMNANARLRLRGSQAQRTALELGFGRLWARAKKRSGTIELHTPAALAVVRGTDWDVEVGARGETTLTVLSGAVEVSNDFGRVEAGPAEQVFVEPGRAPVKRLLVNPRERVQWVMANPIEPARYGEFDAHRATPQLSAIRSAIEAGRLADAHERLTALAAQPASPTAVDLLLSDFELFDGRYDVAQERLERIWRELGDVRAAARLAEWLSALDRSGEARTLLDEALARHPDSAELLLAEGNWQRLQGHTRAALDAYRKAVTHGESNTLAAATRHALGRAELERGDLKRARVELSDAVTRAPRESTYLGELALLATQSHRLVEARSLYDEALGYSGDDFVSLGGTGLLALLRGDAEAARHELLKALAIEPRFARGQVWLAVAEFQLGHRAAALDSLDRASLADPNDPLPWQVRSIIENDAGEPLAAIAAARESLVRMPYLKSLNQLANDSEGSANLGKSLGDFGLEHWARAYAHASSHPLWAGSHFFLADRVESDYSSTSELFLGYLTDPTAFGASERRPTILPRPDRHATAALTLRRNETQDVTAADASLRGYGVEPVPIAWQLRYFNAYFEPRHRDDPTAYRSRGPQYDLGLGIRPREDVGVFLLHNQGSSRTRLNEFALGPDFRIERDATSSTDRTDLGMSYRWSADQLTGFKVHRAQWKARAQMSHIEFGPQRFTNDMSEDGAFVRHIAMLGEHRLGFGWESVERKALSAFGDVIFTNLRANREDYRMPWVAAEWRAGRWSVFAEAYWPSMRFRQSDTPIFPLTGEVLFDPVVVSHRRSSRLLPRFGVAHRFGAGSAVHVAHIESMRAPGSHSLAPIALGNVLVDNQYQLAGTHARKSVVQLDLELSTRTFLGVTVQRQTLRNPRMSGDRLFAQGMTTLFDGIGTLGPSPVSSQTTLATYEETPNFGHGRLVMATTSLNHILAPRWSMLGSYTYADSRNLDAPYTGNLLPGFPRHLLLGQTTWYHGARWFSLLRVVYRSHRYRDEANLQRRPSSWSASIGHMRDSADRNWNYGFAVQGMLKRDEKTSYAMWLRRRW